MQGRERRGQRAGSRGRCTALPKREDGAACPALEGRAKGMERSPGQASPGSEPRAGQGSLGSRARSGRRAWSRGAGAGLMLLERGSLGGGSALGAEGGKGGRSWQRAGEAGRQALAEGREFFPDHPQTLFPEARNSEPVHRSPLIGRCAERMEDEALLAAQFLRQALGLGSSSSILSRRLLISYRG